MRNLPRLPLLVFSAVFLISLFLFVDIAEDILTSTEVLGTDFAVSQFVAMHRTPELTGIFLLVTEFANTTSMLLIGIVAALSYAVLRRGKYLYAFLLAALGTTASVHLLKDFIARTRPPADVAFYAEKLFSFPSGHSASALAIFGFIAYVWLKSLHLPAHKIAIATGATLVILAVGASRIYLGVHYLSDVMGGYLLGALWLMIAIALTEIHVSRKAASLFQEG